MVDSEYFSQSTEIKSGLLAIWLLNVVRHDVIRHKNSLSPIPLTWHLELSTVQSTPSQRRVPQYSCCAMYALEVTLVRALDLPISDYGFLGFAGKSDPYFVFKVRSVKQKSSVVQNNLSPVWSPPERFTFQIDNPTERVLEIEGFDYDRMDPDDSLGTISLALASFLEKRGASEVLSYELDVPASFTKHKKRSYVFLEIKLTSLERADRVLELWENQRYHLVKKWTTDAFLPNDRKRWSAIDDSSVSSDNFEEVAPAVPPRMSADGWTLDVSLGDDNGWIYAPSFAGPWQKEAFSLAMVRRRKWVNRCIHGPTNSSTAA
jgi:hypothetical protein